MEFEIIHFRDAQKVLEEKSMITDVNLTCEYLFDELVGTLYTRDILRDALDAMGWREEHVDLKILPGRRYLYKGVKGEIAMDGSFSSYEYLHTGLLRLQLGYDKGTVESGILLLPSTRSEKSPYGNTADMLKSEMELLFPTISLPVSICLFDLGEPFIPEEN
ncbi:MAG: hypothetical protein K8S18_11385 [Desulfobacula sp.]|nr:hypothetical protein [Desulfobacula sp.]